ncbi:BolA/IbaG family iron-sulfur metabolism protein [Anaplasma capra]|uniref:BolA/IbaG family iron-sulfur metabolism protein n=1 Tax=Anaplasma capra TaxID=1562740 RepID=UPI0021D5BA83|nr:BolA/IbaG family iron-sulfur metabolism protein [Anaplasma capra]MCU7611724.1 BolA/IbaG family iron-sulfur metabolism protein [Anaplasma capra]MCU7612525.1 BolA/IbaG family iron-sulfur metabolism protein [Anaplasma capra]
MGVELSKIRELLVGAFPGSVVHVSPMADDDERYAVRVVSGAFLGKSKLEQHRMVYSALSGVDVHALQIQTEVGEQNGE